MPFRELTTAVGTASVLIVDDEPEMRDLLRRCLRAGGFTVVEATNVAEAQQRCTPPAAPVDLVITDLRMPGVSGDTLIAWLGREHPTLPVLCLTGSIDDEPRPVPVLAKPMTMRKLIAAVCVALGRARERPIDRA
jgi:CheY-like chemotaxis protein